MATDVITGGQGGDEGKGKICAYLAKEKKYSICIRVPSPQAGHSIHYNGKRIGLALLSCGVVNPSSRIFIGAGGLISLEKLASELSQLPGLLEDARLGIDYRATIVTPEHKEKEKSNEYLMKNVGSVGTGVSQCRIEKILRDPNLKFARDIPELKPFLVDTKKEIFEALERGEHILLEGDHGAKLDLIHGEYPMVTTRAVNAAGFLSEAGIGPKSVGDIYIVLKPYTTRVAAGPMQGEIFDEKILEWGHNVGGETGTVSKRLRRMSNFEWENVQEVIRMNSATKLVFTHMDAPEYVWNALGYKGDMDFLANVDKKLCQKWPFPQISLLSYGPEEKHVITYTEYLDGFLKK
jgi:adenylosuccinate synthase